MPPTDDAGLQLARDAADEGLETFRQTLSFYQSNPDPSPAARRHGGVALPGMGTAPASKGASGAPRMPTRPGQSRPAFPKPGRPTPGRTPASGGPSPKDEKAWRQTAEQVALHEMMKARRDFVVSLFDGAAIQYRPGSNPATEARTAATDFAKKAKATGQSAQKQQAQGRSWSAQRHAPGDGKGADAGALGRKAFQLLGDLGASDLVELEGPIMELAGDIFSDLGSSLAPFVGTAKAGAKAGSKWYKTGKKQVNVKRTAKAQKTLIQGDPDQAIGAVKKLLERERNQLAAEAGMATAKLGTDVAGYFVDLGIASGIATACAEAVGTLTLKVRVLVRDAREMKAGNELLKSKKLDAGLFGSCPLLGAYAVAAADTSALVGFLGGDPQRHGFTLDSLEKIIRKHNEPLVRNATELIRHSRLVVTGMPTDRAQARARAGGADRSLKERIKNAVQQKLKMTASRR